jgi:hypothetical protein
MEILKKASESQNRGLKAGPEERQGLAEANRRGNRSAAIFAP